MTPEDFVAAARRFVSAVEVHSDVNEVHAVLAELYAAALSLEYRNSETNATPPRIGDDDWRATHKNMQLLVDNYFYHTVLHGLFKMDGDPDMALGDLGDDLADIWREMKPGILLIDGGAPANDAISHWQRMFPDWGDHAADALHTLHRLLYDDEP